jgi:hypothetical protein
MKEAARCNGTSGLSTSDARASRLTRRVGWSLTGTACRRRGGSGGNAPQRRQHSVTLGGRRGTQWGSAAVREHEEGEGGRNLGKKGSEGGAHRKGEDGGTPVWFHRRQGGSGARGWWWASPMKEGVGCARAWTRERGGGGTVPMVPVPF